MEYTGEYRSIFSKQLGENVSILKYKSDSKFPYTECSRCGQLIKKTMYVVQSDETDVELLYLGSECIKHFG